MKRIHYFTLLLLFACSNSAFSQLWFDAGIKGGYTPGMFINKNLLSDSNYKLKFNGGYTFGGKIGINFSDENSLTVDVMFSNLGLKTDVLNTTNTVTQKGFQIPILYRKNSENGGYGEIGPQITILNSVDVNGTDVTNQFNKMTYGITLGGGQYIGGGDVFGITLGARFSYNFSDMINNDHRDVKGNAIYTPSSLETASKFSYAASNQFYAGLILEFNFNIGYITHGSGCKKGSRFQLF